MLALVATSPPAFSDGPIDSGEAPSLYVFVGVHVVPMDREHILQDQTVVIQNGRIAALGPAGQVAIPRDATLIPSRGRYLMPGLADMHVHLGNERDLILLVANGVTTVRNMWGFDYLLRWRDEIRTGRRLFSPTIHTAGPLLDGNPPIWKDGSVLIDPGRADGVVAGQKREGFDFIKVYVRLKRPVYDAIIESGKKHGMKVMGHVPYDVGLFDVLSSGQVSIEHLDGYMEALRGEDSPFSDQASEVDVRFHSASHVDEAKIPWLARLTGEAGVWNCPTLIVEKKWGTREAVSSDFDRSEMRYVLSPTKRWWRDHNGLNLSEENARVARHGYELRLKLVKALHECGAGLLLGTDAPNPLVVSGFSIHEELSNFVEAGLSPFEALSAGTREPARFLDAEGEFGTIQTGARADLLLLAKNPLEDVSFAREPEGVMLRGMWYDRQDLDESLEDVLSNRGPSRFRVISARGR